ncbi:NACHT domain-containing protein [Streptomyces sp. NBC_00536]|nr:NACHT domain-containing protein [Streptomyces sp. NBC_00536]WUC78345.1 NACHT domain-containing protein [Streptomyces sp. NBC_00536]
MKSLLAQAPGAGTTGGPARPAPRWRRPEELGEAELAHLTTTLAERLHTPGARLPAHERLAALDAVRDAFGGLGPLDPDALFALDLDPVRLAAALPGPPPYLGDAARALYGELLDLCCRHAVEYMTTLPSFAARADLELIRRAGGLGRALESVRDRLGPAPGSVTADFEERYAAYLATAHGRLELYGLTFSQARQEWPLDLAYISLSVSGDQPYEELGRQAVTTVETALSTSGRVLLRGPAGSGKSTLVQWLALNAARRSFGPELRELNTHVPFVLRLRSFTSRDALPMPEEFLRACGVPVHGEAPPGWASSVLRAGRALVLIDGVDEVPQRLRNRTEAWIWSLIDAYPESRFIVTTRPSAVRDDWLSGHAFTPMTLLPMERADIQAFLTHWHDAARAECASVEGRAELDRYEASLGQAVRLRRDLGRLATNPLMCALLCALNRDRHMHLPRARKELYDAALDMLLVRRDSEREIIGVEGVYLTRDEQTLLLQRLAYWLIRNGQVEADCDEAVEMVDEWLDAMPQARAQGSARQVFRHLLIRSGLLREPVPGSVHFVHRTFRDYLGAKAAVEARDFGVLVRNAHEDDWYDVIRMAVGHARPDERARILLQLLRRADRVKRDRSRLVLLAAACLEHAPELDPEVWREVETRTAHLLPPHSVRQAEELAKAGELVLELLPEPADLTEDEAAATIRTAALVGGDRALQVIAGFRRDDRFEVSHEICGSWSLFPTDDFADAVLADAPVRTAHLHISTPGQLAAFDRLPHIRRVHLTWDQGVPPALTRRRDLEWLVLQRNPGLTGLAELTDLPALRHLGVYDCPNLTDIEAVAELPADSLAFGYLRDGLPLAPLAGVPGLRSLVIGYEPQERRIGDVPAAGTLTSLSLWQGARGLTLDGIDRWPGVESLTIAGPWQYRQLVDRQPLGGLRSLQIRHTGPVSVGALVPYRWLTELHLSRCGIEGTLEAVAEFPALRRLVLTECSGVVDLAPLAALDGLTVEVDRRTSFTGADRVPPERLKYIGT